jgi:hypothetical protein
MKNETKGKLYIFCGMLLAALPTFLISFKLGLFFVCIIVAICLVISGLDKI